MTPAGRTRRFGRQHERVRRLCFALLLHEGEHQPADVTKGMLLIEMERLGLCPLREVNDLCQCLVLPTCSTDLGIAEPSLGVFKTAKCMLKFGERSRPLSRRQVEQQFCCPGRIVSFSTPDQAGDNHPMEQYVIAAWSKPGECVGHCETSGEDNDSCRTAGWVANRTSQQKLYSAQGFRGKPARGEPRFTDIVRLTCGDGKQPSKPLDRFTK